MSKSNREKIKELQESLNDLESRVGALRQQIDQSNTFLENIDTYHGSAKEQSENIKQACEQATKRQQEIATIEEDLKNAKEEFEKKLTNLSNKKEELDQFFLRIFGGTDEKGGKQEGLKYRLNKKEEEVDEFINTQKQEYEKLFEKIEGLLPGATSTGLAKAYFDQKQSYWWPKIIWAGLFSIGIVGIVITGALSFDNTQTLQGSLSELIARTPFYVAFIWLAAFSSKQYRQSNRLEQEYAHKESVAKTYQGYKQEFEDEASESTDSTGSTIAQLNKSLIATFDKNPSEVIDDGSKDDSPSLWNRPIRNILKQKNNDSDYE